jgi:non-lysosomal glucosylceramidase
MAAWAVPLALSGFHYSAVTRRLALAPRWQPDDFQSLWTIPSGWGVVRQQRAAGEQVVTWQVHDGSLAVQQMASALSAGRPLSQVTVEVDGHPLSAEASLNGDSVQIVLADSLLLTAGQTLAIRLSIS